jgi:signal transduction histidine kinase/ActR/RegA family two-component response regulator
MRKDANTYWLSNVKSSIQNWLTMGTSISSNRSVTRFHFFAVNAIIFLFVLSVLNYLSNSITGYIITSTAAVCMLVVVFIILKGKFFIARILITLILNGAILGLCFLTSTSTGYYFYYFVFLVGYIYLVRAGNLKAMLPMYVFTLMCIIVSFAFFNNATTVQPLPSRTVHTVFYVNLLFGFFVSACIIFSLLRDSFRKEVALISKQEYLDAMYNTSLDAVFVIDPLDMLIKGCNAQTIQLFNADDRGNFIGIEANRFFEASSNNGVNKFEEILRNSLTTPWKGEFICFTYTGEPFSAYVSMVVLKYEGKDYIKINILDISDIKKAKNDLIVAKEKAEKAAAIKSRFLSNMSHELRTPLNGIIGTTHLLLQGNYNDEQKDHFEVLKFSSEHMLTLINDVLDLGKLELGKMQLETDKLNLQRFIEKIEKTFKPQFQEKGLRLSVDFDTRLNCTMETDFTRLQQVLNNLLSNAVKFTNKGGVTLTIKPVAVRGNKTRAEFAVIDTGIGIDKSQWEYIFDSFTQADVTSTRKYGGTGLGLSISSKLVELLGGRLKLESELNKGSRFSFEIELEANEQGNAGDTLVSESNANNLPSLNGVKILIAEDNPVNMLITTRFLKKWGVEMEKASNGKEAIDLFNRKNFDLLLIDLEMPEIDGFGVVERVREKCELVPVIAFTAAAFSNIKTELESRGFSGYLPKPFKPEELHQLIQQFSPLDNRTVYVA